MTAERYTVELVRQALTREPLVVAMSGLTPWLKLVPQLANADLIEPASKRAAFFSRKNLGAGWDRLAERLEERSRAANYGAPADSGYIEGSTRRVESDRYERDPRARAACIAHWGYRCQVCGLSMHERYGDIGRHFVHVHHLTPIARGERRVDPIDDLRPVCPSCHAMLHTMDPPITIEELQERLI